MQRKNWNKKIPYMPGIISLIFLPFIFSVFAENYYRAHHLKGIAIAWANLEFMEFHSDFFKRYRGHYPPQREYLTIELNEADQTNEIKLWFAQIRIRELVAQKDTLKGVHFLFGAESNYESFIRAIDICRMEKARTYMPYGNNLWFYNLPAAAIDTAQKMPILSCGTTYSRFKPKLSWWVVVGRNTKNIWLSSWPVIVGFIVFSIFSIRLICRQTKNRNDFTSIH